jgi:rod shape-determining protein MreD
MRVILDSTAIRLLLVVPVVLTLQLSLVSEMRIFGATGDIVLLFALVAAMITGPQRGAFSAFAFGLAFDLVLQTPFGLSALAYCLSASVVGRIHGGLYREVWWFAPVTVFLGSAAAVMTWVVAGTVFGVSDLWTVHLVGIVLVVSGLNAVLAPASLRIMRWVLAADLDHAKLPA